MKKVFQSKIVLLAITAFVFIISCTNEFDYGKLINAVKTVEYNNVTQTTADVSGNIWYSVSHNEYYPIGHKLSLS